MFRLLGYEPHPGQVAVHRSGAPRRVLVSGVRWGKSTAAAMEAVAALMAPSTRSIGWIVGPTYDLADRVFSLVRETVEAHLGHRVVEVDRDRRLVLRNLGGGLSEVRAKTADQPVSLLGEGLDWLILDEAARMRREIWEGFLSQRLVDRRGWALLISTPAGRGWFQRLYRQGQGPDPEIESWSYPSWTNPHLDAAAIEAERRRLPDETFRQEYGAEFITQGQEPCLACHGPSPDVPGVVVVDGEEPHPLCPDCGHPVDVDGKTLVRLDANGNSRLKTIRLVPDDPPTSVAAAG